MKNLANLLPEAHKSSKDIDTNTEKNKKEKALSRGEVLDLMDVNKDTYKRVRGRVRGK